MASRAKQGRGTEANSVVTRMCSINLTGLVFLSTRRFDISSELALTIQTCVLGITRNWDVLGWVVECSDEIGGNEPTHRITMLFSNLPSGLQQLLSLAEKSDSRAYPPMHGAEIFGLN